MKKYLIGYKQGNGEYVYVSSITDYNISVTLDNDNAVGFFNEEISKNICNYLNLRDSEKTYIPLIVTVNIEEVIGNDIITNE